MATKALFLKIKIKSLAAEAKIIRKEENKSKYFRGELEVHRKGTVRSECRHTLIAYGFLRDRPYAIVEPACKAKIDWDKVEAMVKRYGVCWTDDLSTDTWRQEIAKQEARFKIWKKSAAPVG